MNKTRGDILLSPPFLLLAVIASFLFFSALNFISALEDAFISFRYAENLAQGYGLVFNCGGEKVEGFSNFSWVILLSLAKKLGFDPIIASRMLGLLFAVGILWVVYRFSRFLSGNDSRLNLLASLLLASNSIFLFASHNGLESQFFSFLFTAGIFLYIREKEDTRFLPFSSLLFALASLTRPEGPLLFMTGMVHRGFSTFSKKYPVKKFLIWIFLFVALYLPYFLWRWHYFGHFFPNPYYIRTGGGGLRLVSLGLTYAGNFFLDSRGWLLFFPLIFLPLATEKVKDRCFIIFIFLAAYLFLIIFSGGDHWVYYYRLFVPLLPLIFLLTQEGLRHIGNRFMSENILIKRTTRTLFFSILAIFFITNLVLVKSPLLLFWGNNSNTKPLLLDNLKIFLKNPDYLRERSRVLLSSANHDIHPMNFAGKWLTENLPASSTIATGQAGQIPYYTGFKTIDLLGLNNNHILHRGLSFAWLWDQKIDYFVLYRNESPQYFFPDTLFPEIILRSDFQSRYQLMKILRQKTLIKSRNYSTSGEMLVFKRSRDKEGKSFDNLEPVLSECVKKDGCLVNYLCEISGRDLRHEAAENNER